MTGLFASITMHPPKSAPRRGRPAIWQINHDRHPVPRRRKAPVRTAPPISVLISARVSGRRSLDKMARISAEANLQAKAVPIDAAPTIPIATV